MRPFFALTASRVDDFWRGNFYSKDLFDEWLKALRRVAMPVPSNKCVSTSLVRKLHRTATYRHVIGYRGRLATRSH